MSTITSLPRHLKPKPTLTEEQRAIVQSKALHLEVHAFAGAGKTAVLSAYAAARPNSRVLYLAYNKSTAVQAKSRFGSHVTCRTTHSLAWPRFGKVYSDKGKLNNLRVVHVMDAFDLQPAAASMVLKTVESFLQADRQSLHLDDVPRDVKEQDRVRVLQLARETWRRMQDVTCAALPMPHDGYLKLYALSEPKLWEQYDFILFDEAQDANPVTAGLLRRQRGRCTVVMVGDPHQAIYGFRGAVNALENAEGATVMPLTGSFRFGPAIALLNSCLLRYVKGEQRLIDGLRTDGGDWRTFNPGIPVTHISRTNANLFAKAFESVAKHRIHFVGGFESYAWEKLLDVYRLSVNDVPKDAFYRRFSSTSELHDYAKQVSDKENLSLLKVLGRYQHDIPSLIAKVRSETVPRVEDATIILSTAHKSKGLEFRQVKVASDDFAPLIDENGSIRALKSMEDIQEVNLHYVAMTRATHAMHPSLEYAKAVAPIGARIAAERSGDSLSRSA